MIMTTYHGIVRPGVQFASGAAVGRADNPFPAATLALQYPYFVARGIDLDRLVPDRAPGTINLGLAEEIELGQPDITVPLLDWTSGLSDARARIAPETFSFVQCRLHHDGRRFPGLIYYPHPETKPATNAHRYDAIEVIAPWIEGLAYGAAASVECRADAFRPRRVR